MEVFDAEPVLESLCDALVELGDQTTWRNCCLAIRPFGLYSLRVEVQRKALRKMYRYRNQKAFNSEWYVVLYCTFTKEFWKNEKIDERVGEILGEEKPNNSCPLRQYLVKLSDAEIEELDFPSISSLEKGVPPPWAVKKRPRRRQKRRTKK